MQRRKDDKGRVLRDGESYRPKERRYMYRYTSTDGKRHAVYAADLNELRQKEEKIQRDIAGGIRVGEDSVTLNDIFEMWDKDNNMLKQTTKSNYNYMYKHFVRDDFGKRKLKSIRKSDVRRFYNSLLDAQKLKVNTLDNLHTVIHQLFNLAVDDCYLAKNPSDGVMGECRKAHNLDEQRRHALTIPQQEAFIGYIRANVKYRHWLPLFTTFLGTGMRVSELVGLRWDDIHLDEGYIEVNHNTVYYQREKGKCYFSVTTPKTEAGKRIIPLLPEVRAAFDNEKAYQKEMEIICEANIDGYTNFIFLNRYGNIHNPQTINRTIKRITVAYNEQEMEAADKENRDPILIPPFSCHNLRHTFCTRYCENETNLKVIQEIMGHRDIATTMEIYAEATKDAKVKSFENLQGKIKIS
ncbi:tyrosine-type recombinase/integrase [Lachnospiraceae bacterium 47-T17]